MAIEALSDIEKDGTSAFAGGGGADVGPVAGAFGHYLSVGNYARVQMGGSYPGNNSSWGSLANKFMLWPVVWGRPFSTDMVQVRSGGVATGGLGVIAVYGSDADGHPSGDALWADEFDFGAGSGYLSAAVSPALTFDRGEIYWVAFGINTAAGSVALTSASRDHLLPIPKANLYPDQPTALLWVHTYDGTAPNATTAFTNPESAQYLTTWHPLVGFRVSDIL